MSKKKIDRAKLDFDTPPVVEDTGMYRTETYTIQTEADFASFLKVLAARPHTLDERLARYEEFAKAVVDGGVQGPMAKDATDLLLELGFVRADLQRGQAESAVFHALQVGRLFEQMRIRPCEPMVKREWTRLAAQITKCAKRAGDTNRRRKLAGQLYDGLSQDHKSRGKMHIYREVARQMGEQLAKESGKPVSVAAETVRKYLRPSGEIGNG